MKMTRWKYALFVYNQQSDEEMQFFGIISNNIFNKMEIWIFTYNSIKLGQCKNGYRVPITFSVKDTGQIFTLYNFIWSANHA